MDFLPSDPVKYCKDKGLVSKFGWHASFNLKEGRSSPPKPPRFKTMAEFTPMAFRYMYRIYFPNKRNKTMPFMDPLNPVRMEPMYGVPLGGIGCGTVGRGYKGEFCRSSLRPGIYNHKVNIADQFIVTVFRNGQSYQKVLSPHSNGSPIPLGLMSWSWGFPADKGHYIGLYPRSWTIYELPEVDLVLICEQISPVIPHNYKDSSMPLGVFQWTVLNFHPTQEARVSITLTWRGTRYRRTPPVADRGAAGPLCCDPEVVHPTVASVEDEITRPFDSDQLHGCLIETRIGYQMPCCFGVAAAATKKVKVTRCPGFQYKSLRHSVRNGRMRNSESVDDSLYAFTSPTVQSDSSPSSAGSARSSLSSSSDTASSESGSRSGYIPFADPDAPDRVLRSHLHAPHAAELWKDLKETGSLSDEDASYRRWGDKKRFSKLAVAVCASCVVPSSSAAQADPGTPHTRTTTVSHSYSRSSHAGHAICSTSASSSSSSSTSKLAAAGSATMLFFVTWHIPRVHFRSAVVAYRRRYVRWFSEDILKGTRELLLYASENWQKWRKAIIKWQAPILDNPDLPEWYKSALFNELYFVSDGGTVWLDPLPSTVHQHHQHTGDETPIDAVRRRNPHVSLDPLGLTGRAAKGATDTASVSSRGSGGNDAEHPTPRQARVKHGLDMGLFAYLEGHEYRMFNTYDVHFNASWMMIQLWPRIELAMLYDLIDMTASEDTTSVTFIYKNQKGPRNARLGVPHDCGDPEREPWYNVNAYIMYPTDNWKDLAPKFILMAWRDWRLTCNTSFLHYALPVVISVIKRCLEKWDNDDDGIIENAGFPDQTYDTWKSNGLSAYVGGLWIAALYAAHDMLAHAGHGAKALLGPVGSWAPIGDNLSALLKKACATYHERLWGGKFYRYDATIPFNPQTNSVMSDQLSGYWFLRIGGAPIGAILPVDAVNETLRSIVRLNWLSVRDGRMGAINSVLASGKTDTTNLQAEEFWVAVNYGIGALLILHGMRSEGFRLAGACFEHVSNKMGLHFQTPEAYTKDATYRSLGYMRPLAIWSIHRALELLEHSHSSS